MATSIPDSNKKVFLIAIIVGLIALAGFTYLVKTNPNAGVDKAVLKDEVDPNVVFDAPFTKVDLYYIDLEKNVDNASSSDAIGCGDGLKSYEIPVGELNGTTKVDAATFALSQLFNNAIFTEQKNADGSDSEKAYNALGTSNLAIKTIKEGVNEYDVRLSGTLKIGGACDAPRIQAQIEKTVSDIFAPAKVTVYLNDKPLADAVSSK